MKCLIVVAHPLENSLCRHLSDQIVKHLMSKGYDLRIKDLYEEEFQPVLTKAERESYYSSEFDQRAVQNDIKELLEAESLVLIFPTWWFGFPAILKGWFDRVWVPGHAYNHASNLGMITPLLTKLKEVNVVTTLGSPWWVDYFILRQPIKRVLKMAIVGTCARNVKFKMFSLYQSETLTQSKIDNFIRNVKTKL